ncbi:MAG: hypothetical protein EB132_04805 [Actinobacteria bacterium]|nr:hypothetical protein [Actinomycetota bacterium]
MEEPREERGIDWRKRVLFVQDRVVVECNDADECDTSNDVEGAKSFLSKLSLIRPAVSLGGPETLACHPASSTHVSISQADQQTAGITPGLIRLSVGLEDTRDLLADITSAL